MLQKIRKQMAEQRVKEMRTPSPVATKTKTPTPPPKLTSSPQRGATTSSPRIVRRRRSSKTISKGAAKKTIKAWMVASFSPTSDYYGETIVDADIPRDTTINTIPKVRKRLVETISATPVDYVRDLLTQSQDDVPKEAIDLLTDEELKKIYVAFEKARIRKVGLRTIDEEEDEWTFRLKTFSDEMELFIEQGKRCATGKVFNTITKRCASPPKERQQLKKRRV